MTFAFGSRHPCDHTQVRLGRSAISCPQRDKPWVLATAILGSSLAFIEGSVVNLAMPAIQADFATSSTDLQWVVNAYLLVLGSAMLTGGSLGDRYGLRRVFIIGTGIFGCGALACAFAPSLPWLILARLVQGLGGALLVPASLALIGSHFDEHERGRAIGLWAGASALTTALGPVAGGWLVDQSGWPAVFWLIAPFAALTTLLAWWRVPVSPRSDDGKLDYLGASLLVATLACLIYALVQPGSRALIALSLPLAACFVWHERRHPAPMLPFGLFRSRSFSGANLITLLLYFALSGALYFLPFNLIQIQGYTAVQAGAAFLPLTLMLGVGSAFAGGLIRRLEPRVILTVGPMIAAAGFAALAIPGIDGSYVTGFFPGIAIIGAGMTLSVAPLTTVVMSWAGSEETGIASGVNNTVARLAGVLAVAMLTVLAVERFGTSVEARLQEQGVPAAVIATVSADAPLLAELEPPPDVPAKIAATIDEAIARAYVATFRVLVIICGALAALAGVIAWFSLGDGQASRGRMPDGDQRR